MLFSEPKIPQSPPYPGIHVADGMSFSALQRAENSSIDEYAFVENEEFEFQCSSASRKFLNVVLPAVLAYATCFSALQRAENSSIILVHCQMLQARNSFSALQRAENSSMPPSRRSISTHTTRFQCSSASRKFLNLTLKNSRLVWRTCFSALQRAENSSISGCDPHAQVLFKFQCSSASRKFLNMVRSFYLMILKKSFSALQRAENSSICCDPARQAHECQRRFSALQRAENSSIMLWLADHRARNSVSVLFSEPKIPQSVHDTLHATTTSVSVLFSEPKIPQ